MRVIVIGHGPSVFTGRGSVIDSFDAVIRLKRGLINPDKDWGSRTDYLCARHPRFDHGHYPFWLLEPPANYTAAKPTTGLCAVVAAMERLRPASITVIGFDRIMHPQRPDPPNTWLGHNKWAEHEYLKALGVQELG